jgi:hypothetical protein
VTNEGKAFSILATWKSYALVPHSTSVVVTKLGSNDGGFLEGILFFGQDSEFA